MPRLRWLLQGYPGTGTESSGPTHWHTQSVSDTQAVNTSQWQSASQWHLLSRPCTISEQFTNTNTDNIDLNWPRWENLLFFNFNWLSGYLKDSCCLPPIHVHVWCHPNAQKVWMTFYCGDLNLRWETGNWEKQVQSSILKNWFFQQVPYFRVKLKTVVALMQFSSEYQLWPVFNKKYETKLNSNSV